jgi:cyclophilin family peptidyl-prolyl cis-trans isomerase
MSRLKFSLTVAFGAFTLPLLAQNMPPVVTNPIADFTVYAGAPARWIDLSEVFTDPDMSHAVRMTTVLGAFDIALFGQQKPITVANFLKYVDDGRYFIADSTTNLIASSFIHRAVSSPGIIQGGGLLGTVDRSPPPGAPADSAAPTQVLPFAPIQNEPGISNKRGTIAMAKVANDPNSATSQWFINVIDNLSLDAPTNNGGYTVFGRVVRALAVVDEIAAVPRFNASGGEPDSPFTDLPLRNYTSPNAIRVPNLVSIPSITQISPLSFGALSGNENVEVTVIGTKLLVSGKSIGSAQITVAASDFDGAVVPHQFNVDVVAAPGRLVQLSTRMHVGTGDNALIGGFIMQGASPKRLMIRALGPYLTPFGVPNVLANPTLELRDSAGTLLASNDNWGDAPNKDEMMQSGVALTHPNESGILLTVPSSVNNASYTAIVRGVNNTAGVGLVEVYDLDSGPGSTLLNISTRGEVNVDPKALIGGFFICGTESKTIVVRAIGPSLSGLGVSGALSDPTLEFFNGQGTKLDENNDWETSANKAQIQASGLAPTNSKESAVLQTLAAGPYTAVVRGANSGTGIGSVEVYQLP